MPTTVSALDAATLTSNAPDTVITSLTRENWHSYAVVDTVLEIAVIVGVYVPL